MRAKKELRKIVKNLHDVGEYHCRINGIDYEIEYSDFSGVTIDSSYFDEPINFSEFWELEEFIYDLFNEEI